MHYSLFTYYPETKCFVTDISDLPLSGVPFNFQIIGKENIVSFNMIEAVRDHENDIICWDYRGRHSDYEYTARIMND